MNTTTVLRSTSPKATAAHANESRQRTDRRVIFKRGILSRYTVEMNVSKIDKMEVSQTRVVSGASKFIFSVLP